MARTSESLLASLNGIGLVDHHAHGILRTPPATLDEFRGLFSESPDPRQWPHVATGLTYRRAIRTLAARLGCEASEEAVFEHRTSSDPAEYASSLLRATGTELLLVDDGYPPPGEGAAWDEMGELAACEARPVLRIERVAEEALGATFGEFRLQLRGEVAHAQARGYAALKTILAYRSGLEIGPPDLAAAERAFAGAEGRLESKALLELALWEALEANADRLPVQVHVGFGDSDLNLARSHPGHLKPVVERFPDTPFVLLHCYPFVREAGWLAHVYANVYLDLSLTIPHVSRPAEVLRQALELAPVSKLLYASDAARTPELYFLAAAWWREALAEVLGAELPPGEAEEAGRAVLRENALRLYRLE